MKTQFYPGYTIGNDAYENIVKICSIYGKKAVVIGGERAIKAAENKIKNAEEIKLFDKLGYTYDDSLSDDCTYVFIKGGK